MILLKKAFTTFLSFIILFMCGIFIFTEDSDCRAITVFMGVGRFWDAFDGKLPSIDNAAHWFLGDSKLDLSNSEEKIPPGGKLVEGDFKVSSQKKDSEVLNFSKFGPAAAKNVYKASGTFYEVLIYLHNSCSTRISTVLSKEDNKTLNAKLVLDNKTALSPIAFRIPGFDAIDEKSLFTSFEGRLSVSLPAKSRTWLLLVFDISKNIQTGKLHIFSSVVYDIKFPDRKNIPNENISSSEKKCWETNCKAVQSYKTELKFSMSKSWKQGEDSSKAITTYTTNREALLDILGRFQLDDEKDLHTRLLTLIKMVKNAPAYNAVYPENTWLDVTLSNDLFNLLGKFMNDVSARAEKNSVHCGK